MRKSFAILVCLASALLAAGPEFERARTLYNQTNFDQSVKILLSIPNKDASVNALVGRNYYMQGEYKKATEFLEKAVAADPQNAEYVLWLGRAFGRRAESASPFTAPGYASKTRQYFEKSVQLNPHDVDAMDDLFEYYLDAPGFLGGGMDKAQAMADRIAQLDPSQGESARARMDEHRKQYAKAEEHLRRAIELAPHKVDRVIELAQFLSRQGRIPEADQNLARADEMAPNRPTVMYAKAELYVQKGRNLSVAKELLQRYLTSSLTPDDPPRADAQKLLRQLQDRTRSGGA